MPTQIPSANSSLESAQQEMADLRRWAGIAKEFWPRYLLALAGLTNANKVIILLQDTSQPGKWKRLGDWSSNKGPAQPLVEFAEKVEVLAVQCLVRLTLVADVPASFQANLVSLQARSDVERFAATLDVMVLVNAEKRFLAAAMALCNGVASRFSCERVSLGWLENGYIRLRTI